MENAIFFLSLNTAVSGFSIKVGTVIAIQKEFVQQLEMGEKALKTYIIFLHIYVSLITVNIVIMIIRSARYHLLLASNSTFMTDSLYLGTNQKNTTYLTPIGAVICQIDTNFSQFQSLNMLPFYIRLEHLKLIYYSLFSIFSKSYLTQAQFASFSYFHIYLPPKFDSNYFGILLQKIVKPYDHEKVTSAIGKLLQKHKPIRHCFMMSRKYLSCSFVNKVYDNYNKVSYLQNKNIITWKSLFRRK